MHTSFWRRMGAVFVMVVVLGVALAPVASAAPEQRPANAPSASGCEPTYYRVRWGDNLTSIAWRHGVTIWQLQQWNGISNPNRIYAGRTLVVYRCERPQPQPHPQRQPQHRPQWRPQPQPQPEPEPQQQPPPQPQPQPEPEQGWDAEYFDNPELEGEPVFSRVDEGIGFDWTGTSPEPDSIPQYYFSARWTHVFSLEEGTYRVTATADDGVRVWIDDVLVIDAWDIQSVRTFVQDVHLQSGDHTWRVEYFQAEGEAVIQAEGWKIS